MYDIAIQIVNYNTKTFLKKCLDSIYTDLEGSDVSYAIYVLDNHSEDDLSDLIDLYAQYQNIFFSVAEKNCGFGAGHNTIARQVEARYILLLNPDTHFLEKRTISFIGLNNRQKNNKRNGTTTFPFSKLPQKP